MRGAFKNRNLKTTFHISDYIALITVNILAMTENEINYMCTL